MHNTLIMLPHYRGKRLNNSQKSSTRTNSAKLVDGSIKQSMDS